MPTAPHPRTRATASLVAVVLLAATGVAIVQVRADAIAAEEAERLEAQQELDRDVFELRSELMGPAHAAERTSAELLVTVVETVTGSDRDEAAVRDTLDGLIVQLHEAADELEAAAAQPLPHRPRAVPVPVADAIFQRLSDVEDQAAQVATQLRQAAEDAERFASAAHELNAAAATYAASTDDLPDSDDPDVLAAAWRAERDRLDDYVAAVDAASETAGLEELSAAHQQLVGTLRSLADDAVSTLEAGDVDGYNAHLDEVADDLEGRSIVDSLVAATETALEAAAVDGLQAARAAALTLLIDLEDLRRVTGPGVS